MGDLRWPLGALVLGLAGSALAQVQTPYHLFTDEYVVWACGLGALVHAVLAHRVPERGVGWLIGLGLAGGAGLALGHEVANAAVHGCAAADGRWFFWSTWLPLVLFTSVTVRALAQRRPGWRWVLVVPALMGGLSLVHDVGQLVAGVEVMDPWVGLSRAYDQRADMSARPLHLLQRLWLVAVTIAVLALDRGRRLLAGGLALATLWSAGGVGLGWGGTRLFGALSATLEDDGVVLHYDPRVTSRGVAERVAGRTAYRLQHYLDTMELVAEQPVSVRLFADDDVLYELTGRQSAHAGYYWLNVSVDSSQRATLAHELVHAVEPALGLRVATLLNRGHVEGLATSWTNGMWEVPEAHADLAAALQADVLPDADVFMRLGGFVRVAEGNAYTASASFVGWLILEHGAPTYRELRASGLDYEATYGVGLDVLDAQWKAFLATVEVTAEDTAQAWGRFSPLASPGFVAQRCPKLGHAVPTEAELASLAWREGDLLEAAERYGALAESEPHHRQDQVISLLRAGAYPEALAALDRWEAPDALQDQRLSLRIEALMGLRRWGALEEVLAERRALGGGSPAREALERLLLDPDTREATAAVVLPGTPWRRRQAALGELRLLRGEQPDVRFLWLRDGFYAPRLRTDHLPPGTEEAWQEAIAVMPGTPGACDELGPQLGRAVAAALPVGELGFAERLLSSWEEECTTPTARWAQGFYRKEIAFWQKRSAR